MPKVTNRSKKSKKSLDVSLSQNSESATTPMGKMMKKKNIKNKLILEKEDGRGDYVMKNLIENEIIDNESEGIDTNNDGMETKINQFMKTMQQYGESSGNKKNTLNSLYLKMQSCKKEMFKAVEVQMAERSKLQEKFYNSVSILLKELENFRGAAQAQNLQALRFLEAWSGNEKAAQQVLHQKTAALVKLINVFDADCKAVNSKHEAKNRELMAHLIEELKVAKEKYVKLRKKGRVENLVKTLILMEKMF